MAHFEGYERREAKILAVLKGTLFYMEAVLANVWFIEDGIDVNEAWMQVAETIYGTRA